MKHVLMAAGGSIDTALLADFYVKNKSEIDCIVACDRGYEALCAAGLRPDIVIGDMDSMSAEMRESLYIEEQGNIQDGSGEKGKNGNDGKNEKNGKNRETAVIRLNPVKDDTDTEAAIRVCTDRGAEKIYLFGATGNRLDHVLGNIELLAFAGSRGCELFIIDPHNRIRLCNNSISIKKSGQWGRFVSLIPYTPVVEKLTLRGFKYELTESDIKKGNTLGISNEITADTADISFSKGSLIVIESLD